MSYSDYGAYIWKNGVDITKQFADTSFYFSDGWKEVEEESEIKDQPMVEGHAVLIFKNFAGYGSGDGYGIKSFNNKTVYVIDNIQTIITHVFNNIAKGFILNKDLSLDSCYIAKGHNFFAHGKTAKKL